MEDEPEGLLEEQFQTSLSRFDLEQRIMNCWNVVNDIQALVEEIKDKNLSDEELIKILSGLDSVYNMKFNNMFDCFEKLIKADKL